MGKPSSATSAVVIYDDHGRTAIFTSPRKNMWDSSSYDRQGGAARRWQQDETGKRRPPPKEEDGRKHQKDNGMGSRRWQSVENEDGASGTSVKKSSGKPVQHRQGMMRRLGSKMEWERDKVASESKTKRFSIDQQQQQQQHRHNTGHRSNTSSSDSDSSYSSCSSYSSSSHSGSDSPVQRRGRGQWLKRVQYYFGGKGGRVVLGVGRGERVKRSRGGRVCWEQSFCFEGLKNLVCMYMYMRLSDTIVV